MSGASRKQAILGGAATTILMFAALFATEPWLAMGWDEGYTLGRQDRIRWWLQAMSDPANFASSWTPPSPIQELAQTNPNQPPPRADQIDTRSKLLEKQNLEWFWPFAREEPHGHPPFYALVGLIGDWVTPGRQQLPRARLGTMILFSLAGGAIFAFLARRFEVWTAAIASAAWLLQPRFFAEAHYATYDAILSSLWGLAVLAFAQLTLRDPAKRGGWGWGITFGLLLGCAASTKFTGCALGAPLLVWSLIRLDRRALKWLVLGGLIAALTLWVCNPPWWFDPISGFERFVRSNTTRSRTINIETMYLGTIYSTPRESLPWHNTLVWTVFVVPVGFLALAVIGIVRSLKRWRSEPFGLLVLLNWTFLMVLRAMPHTPGHDGVRQFLPAFGLLAVLAGLGCGWIVESWGRWGKGLAAFAIIEGIISIAMMMPVPLSYYSPIVGGLPGANRLGMEPTYYWDSLDRDALDWLNDNTPEDGSVAFATNPTNWIYMRKTGQLQAKVAGFESTVGLPTWLVVQNRRGALSPERDLPLIESAQPAYVVSKWGVPLIWVFPYPPAPRSLIDR